MGNIIAPSGASLFDAIAEGDAVAAVEVLQAHPGLTRKRLGTKKRTLYHYCAASGQVAVLKALCEYVWRSAPDEGGGGEVRGWGGGGGADGLAGAPRLHPAILKYINASDQKGLTPLSLACKKGHGQVVSFLLSQGADPWVKDRHGGRTALHWAARANHPECISAILSSPHIQVVGGPDSSKPRKLADLTSNAGYTPLHYAAAAHSREAAAALLRHGADPNAKTLEVGFEHIQLDRGSTPLHAAARYQSLDVAVLLLRHWDEALAGKDVTDPRVVENLPRLKPYQMPGVKLNKTLTRVLDPATSMREIRGMYGGGGDAVGACSGGSAAPAPPTSLFNRQDSGSSRLSGTGSGGAEDLRLAAAEAAAAPAIAPPSGVDRASPRMPLHRQASSGAARQAPGVVEGDRDAPPEPQGARTSRGSDGPLVRGLAADVSSKRSCFMEEAQTASITTATPASPFSPKAAGVTTAGGGDGGAAPLAMASPFTICNDRSGRRHRIAPSQQQQQPLPVPSFLTSPTAAGGGGNGGSLAAAVPPPPSPGGPMGRTRSGAVFPMPPAPCSSYSAEGRQLHRTRSLQQSATATATAAPPAATAFPPSTGSEGRAAAMGHARAMDTALLYRSCGSGAEWASPGFGLAAPEAAGGGAGENVAAAPSARATAASWAIAGRDDSSSQPPAIAGVHVYDNAVARPQQYGTLSARSQSAREGSVYGGAAAGSSPSPPPPCRAATPSGSVSARHDGHFKPQPPAPHRQAVDADPKQSSSPSWVAAGRRSLAKSFSRKLSSLAAAATGSSAVRHDEVRACSPGRGSGSGGGCEDGARSGGAPPRAAPAAEAAVAPPTVPGWALQLAVGKGGGKGGAGGCMVPPPAVRSAF